MDEDQEWLAAFEEPQQHRRIRVRPTFVENKATAEVYIDTFPPSAPQTLGLDELEELVADAQRVISFLRHWMARYYIATELRLPSDRPTRHLILREALALAPEARRTICGRAQDGREWAFTPLVYPVDAVYHLCHRCGALYHARERKHA